MERLADAPNEGGFTTGIAIHNAWSTEQRYTLTVIGGGKRKEIVKTIAPLSVDAVMLDMPPGRYGLSIYGQVSGVAQYAQDGRYYESAEIPVYA